MLSLDEVFQPVRTEVPELSVGADEIPRRTRENDLTAVCCCGDPRCAMHVQTDIPLPSDKGFARVNSNANTNGASAQAVADLLGSRNGVRGSAERCKTRITLHVHVDARVPRQSVADDRAMSCEKLNVRVAALVKQLRRAFNVGEEKRDCAGREILSHAELIFPLRWDSRPVRPRRTGS